MQIRLSSVPFDPYREICAYQDEHLQLGQFGAMTHFIGVMRSYNDGEAVTGMWLEHYPGMTEAYLAKISDEAATQWEVQEGLIIHRTGNVIPGAVIVLVAIWAAHRKGAFAACQFIIEELKTRAPFWKQEETVNGKRWVSKNTPGL